MNQNAQPHFLLTGASGLLGSAITRNLDKQHLSWKALRHGEDGWDPERGIFDPAHLHGVTGVVHLAGENIAAGRWTPQQKQKIRDSRVNGTRALAEAIAGVESKPTVFVCASATGIYGDRGEEVCKEHSSAGDGYLPDVVAAWESAADSARKAGVRVVHLRLGIVLSPEGGALKKMLPPFRFGLGGRLGNGRMWMSWIHLEDAASAFVQAANQPEYTGIYNLVSPGPVRNTKFTRNLGAALHRPTVFPVPGFMVNLLFGEMGKTLLLASTRVMPGRLNAQGFAFQYPEVEGALGDLL